MSHMDREWAKWNRPTPIDDPKPFRPISKAQVNFIKILSDTLNLTTASRNSHILAIIPTYKGDIYDLSMSEGCTIIDKFKQWKNAEELKR